MVENTSGGEDFDANAALAETKALWLNLGKAFRDYLCDPGAWVEGPEDADRAIQMAARAEACFWRASGEMSAIDVERFIPELAERQKGGDA